MTHRPRNWNSPQNDETENKSPDDIKLEQLLIKQKEWCPKAIEELDKNGILYLSVSLSPFTQHPTHIH